MVRRQTAHVGIPQEPRPGLADISRLNQVRVPGPKLPLAPVEELVAHEPAVEPQGLAVEIEVQELRGADPGAREEGDEVRGGLGGCVLVGEVVWVREVGEERELVVALLLPVDEGLVAGIELADDAGVALVEDIV